MEEKYRELLAELRREFPSFRLVRKDASPLSRLLGHALYVCTLGAQKHYLDRYQTTLGQTVYVTPDWEDRPFAERYVTLRHERVHLRQFRRFSFPGMALLYLFLPLPMGVAWGRAMLEREAYEESLRAAAEVFGLAHVQAPAFRDHILAQFTSGAYGWMWPFRQALNRWYDGVVRDLPLAKDKA
jgi:hypothetical protein